MRRTRILVVDDEPAIRKLLRANLEKSGFDALAAGDGAEAFEAGGKGITGSDGVGYYHAPDGWD